MKNTTHGSVVPVTLSSHLSLVAQIRRNIAISNIVGGVKRVSGTLRRALENGRHFALVDCLPRPTSPGGQDKKIELSDVVEMRNGLHFFTAPSQINPGKSEKTK
jgi:hypothetical protein